MVAETTVEAPQKSSRWEDFVDIYFSPAELFARRANESWVTPFVLLCLVCIALYYVFLPVNALVWEAAMVANAPPDANLEQMRKGAQLMKYLGGIFVPIGYGFVIAVTALGLKLASAVIEPAEGGRQSFLIATFAMFVAIPQQIVTALLVFMKSQTTAIRMSDASAGVLRFVEDPDPVTRALLGRFDLFAVWAAVLCAVGLVVIVRMPRGKAAATAAIAWLLVAVPGVLNALLFGRK